ncbi:MAG: hypothetical protein IKJ65_05415 [Clostridia bacterium]|nr:hypothetical protein [Clostridia bacterium]
MAANDKKKKIGQQGIMAVLVLIAAAAIVIFLVGGQNRLKDVEVFCVNGEISAAQRDEIIRSSTLKMGAQIEAIADIENDVRNGVNATGFARFEKIERISNGAFRLTVSIREPLCVVQAGGYYVLIDEDAMVIEVISHLPRESYVCVTGADISNYSKGKTLVLRKEKQLEDIIRIASAIRRLGYESTYSEFNVKDLKSIYLVTTTNQMVEIFDGKNIEQTLQMVNEIISSGRTNGKIIVSGDYAVYDADQ